MTADELMGTDAAVTTETAVASVIPSTQIKKQRVKKGQGRGGK